MLGFLSRAEALRGRLLREKGVGAEALARLVREKQGEFAGLLSGDAAVYAVAKGLGVEEDSCEPAPEFTQISGLSDGMRASVRGTVGRVHALKEFSRNGRTGRVVRISIEDSGAAAQLVLWDREAERAHAGGLAKGDVVEVLEATARQGISGMELELGMAGSLKRVSQMGRAAGRISGLSEGRGFDGDVRVLERFGARGFSRGGKDSVFASFTVGDETGLARLVLWEPAALLAEKIGADSVVRVEDGVGRLGRNGAMELHVGREGRVTVLGSAPGFAGKREILGCKARLFGEVGEGGQALVKARLKEIVSVAEGGRRARAVFSDGSGEFRAELAGDAFLSLFMVRGVAPDISSRTLFSLKGARLPGNEFLVFGRLEGGVFAAEEVEPVPAGC
ncbi:MAG: hypothetical protein PHF51_00490 [Candidatus ainarchaeum sp.]|nr:hypothetical protein [Candidatus ainarchaeum sp.]